MAARGAAFLATLGLFPSVVTLALDCLLEQGFPIEEVVIIHTNGGLPRIQTALERLDAEWVGRSRYRRADIPCRLRLVELRLGQTPIDEPSDRAEVDALFATIFGAVRDQKIRGRQLHFSIAGGRKTMTAYAVAVAQLLFTADDYLWHLLSSPELERSEQMHAPRPGDASLVPIPVISHSAIPMLLTTQDPVQATTELRERARDTQREQQREFVERVLTSEERQVVRELLRQILVEGRVLSNEQLARRLLLGRSKLESTLTVIYDKLSNFRAVPPEERVDRTLLVAFVSGYFQEQFNMKP